MRPYASKEMNGLIGQGSKAQSWKSPLISHFFWTFWPYCTLDLDLIIAKNTKTGNKIIKILFHSKMKYPSPSFKLIN